MFRVLARRLVRTDSLVVPTRNFAGSSESAVVTVSDLGDGVAQLTLNDPDRLNALTVTMGEQFVARAEELTAMARTGEVRAVILTGAGRAFSAGGDLAWLQERHSTPPAVNEATMVAFYGSYLGALRSLPVPTIACLQGPAIGAGMCLSLGCDVRVAAKDAKLGFTFVGLNLHPGMGCTHYLPSIAGPETAARLMLSGEVVRGEEALKLGFVSEVAPDASRAHEASLRWAKRAAAGGPAATSALLATLRQKQDAGLDAALQREAASQAICYTTKDFLEGLAAVSAKRAPNFEGH